MLYTIITIHYAIKNDKHKVINQLKFCAAMDKE